MPDLPPTRSQRCAAQIVGEARSRARGRADPFLHKMKYLRLWDRDKDLYNRTRVLVA